MPRHRNRRGPHGVARRRLLAILASGLVLGVGATATLAAWNDAEVGTGGFSASVFVSEAKDTASSSYAQTSDAAPATLTFAVAGLSPSATATAGLDVRTTAATTVDGQAVLTAIAAGGAGTLTAQLDYKVAVLAGTGTACSDSTIYTDATFTDTTAAVPAGKSAAITKAAGNVVRFCFQVRMKPTAPSTIQGQSGTLKWTVTATSNQ
ncbi:SipW-dependent-type signal peptide-containing protein [Agromyces sp. NPDC060279]|uniref:SipW-dependent-type signal peptide-containing protein n=1 Tax=Agromyces sp. NPDC060279 TaxID=3347092 RepID=UPI0036620E25